MQLTRRDLFGGAAVSAAAATLMLAATSKPAQAITIYGPFAGQSQGHFTLQYRNTDGSVHNDESSIYFTSGGSTRYMCMEIDTPFFLPHEYSSQTLSSKYGAAKAHKLALAKTFIDEELSLSGDEYWAQLQVMLWQIQIDEGIAGVDHVASVWRGNSQEYIRRYYEWYEQKGRCYNADGTYYHCANNQDVADFWSEWAAGYMNESKTPQF